MKVLCLIWGFEWARDGELSVLYSFYQYLQFLYNFDTGSINSVLLVHILFLGLFYMKVNIFQNKI